MHGSCGEAGGAQPYLATIRDFMEIKGGEGGRKGHGSDYQVLEEAESEAVKGVGAVTLPIEPRPRPRPETSLSPRRRRTCTPPRDLSEETTTVWQRCELGP
jgi:hypothetical protein